MRLALCNEVLADRPFAAQCETAAALGHDGLEIAPYTLADDPRSIPRKVIRQTRRALADAGIVATGLHWLLVRPDHLSITSADEAVHRRTRDVLLATVDLCAELGGDVLVHGSPGQRTIPEAEDRQRAEARALDLFSGVAAEASATGVTYCLEPLRRQMTNYVNTVAEAAAIVEQINSPAFKTMVDTSSAAATEDLAVDALIRKWMPTGVLAHIQFNDRNRRAAGQGRDRFRDILLALGDTGYSGTIAMEPFVYEPSPDACAGYAIAYVRGLMEGLGSGPSD